MVETAVRGPPVAAGGLTLIAVTMWLRSYQTVRSLIQTNK